MSVLSAKHITKVIRFLNENADYAVLRNFEGLPNNNKSRDIDIIITRKSYRAVKNQLVQMIDESGWKIITYFNSDRLITYVCAYQDEKTTELVQWDFFVNTSVWGILLMDAKEFLVTKKFNSFLYYVDIEYQFLDKYLYNRIVGSQYPEKYATTRQKAESSPFVIEKVKTLYGVESLEVCDKLGRGRLVAYAMISNLLHRPCHFIHNLLLFFWTFINNYHHSRTGFSIGFTGPDGSGKTTVIDLLIENLGDVFCKAHTYFHFRPTLFGNLGEVAHSTGMKKNVDRNYDKPHRGDKTSILSSLLRLFYYSIDYIIGYFLKVKTITRITRLVFFDRYYTDIICDSRRSRIYMPTKFLYWFGRLFIPALDYNILLTASTTTILNRKKELDKESVEVINKKIDYLKNKKGYYKILNEGTPQETVTKILALVFEEQHRKNLKRLS